VLAVRVDFAAQRAHLRFDPTRAGAAALQAAVRRLGYRVGPAGPMAARVELLRVLWAWLAMMQVMMLAWPAYVATPGELSPDIAQLLRIAQLVLTVPVLLFSAAPLLRAAASQLRARRIGMDVPIALGLLAAFGASVWATARSDLGTPVYFDSIAMFVALVQGSRWLQSRWLGRATARIAAAAHDLPLTAQRCLDYPASSDTAVVAADALATGDVVRIAAGEIVPADARVLEGASNVSQAWLTGESEPLPRSVGEALLAGSINLEQPLIAVVERTGEATSIAALRRLAEDSAADRPPTVEAAQRVARVFLWLVAAVTVVTFAGWWFVDAAQALPHAIAVLVATCPCALALAAPAALIGTQAAMARRGVLCTRAAALEALARIDLLACDKTGTLTTGAPQLLRLIALRSGHADDLLAQAAALDALAVHPFAAALREAAGTRTLPPVVHGRVVSGSGVEGRIDGRVMRLGGIGFAAALAGARADTVAAVARAAQRDAQLAHRSVALLADERGALALFVFDEALRPGAAQLRNTALTLGIDLALLSGDASAPVARRAAELGIDNALARLSPAAKRAWVREAQQHGRRVAMLGDGVNDAPVLAQADVSLAMAGGSRLAQARADFLITVPRLEALAAALQLARRGMRVLRQNFGWALAYNLVAIPLAAFGWIGPLGASLGMAASSLLVVANSLRISAHAVPAD
jgi:Cu2+-exporting ATPase